MYKGYLESPIGSIQIHADDKGITLVKFCEIVGEENENTYIQLCKQQLKEYFTGARKRFDVALHISTGTVFQHACWNALQTIPYGETRSYYDQAVMIGNENAVRAVGGANHKNPI